MTDVLQDPDSNAVRVSCRGVHRVAILIVVVPRVPVGGNASRYGNNRAGSQNERARVRQLRCTVRNTLHMRGE